MAITDQGVVEHVHGNIDKGDYRLAYDNIHTYIFDAQRVGQSAIGMELWFLLILAYKLCGWRAVPPEWREAMRSAPDYSPLLEGDLRLREMRRCIRARKLARAHGLRKQIVELYKGDARRMLDYWEAVASLYAARGQTKLEHRTRIMIVGHRRKLARQALR